MSSTKELNFVDNPSEDLLCPICAKVLVDPHVTDCCGQHFCQQCLTKWFQEQFGRKICPHCRSKSFTHIRYLPLKRKINDFQVYCSNRKDGCTTITKVNGLDDHLSECLYATVKCSYKCGQALFRKDLTNHTKNKCPYRPSTCMYCQKRGKHCFTVGIQHLKSCPDFPVGCPKNCPSGSTVKRKDLPSHRLVCPLESLNCPDCRVNLLRQDLQHHLRSICPKRIVKCKYCQISMTYDSTYVHEQTCPEYPVTCPRRCDLVVLLRRKDLVHHAKIVCPLEPDRCNGCSRIIIRKDMDDHCTNECPKRPTTCTHCKKSGPYDDITGMHVNECEEYPIGCPRKCKGSEQMKRKKLKNHAETYCPLEPVQCPFSEVGCNPLLVRRDLNNHVKSNMESHMLKLMSAHTSLVAEHKKLLNDHSKLHGDHSKLHGDHSKLHGDHSKIRNVCSGLQSELADVQTKHSNFEARIDVMTSSISHELRYIEYEARYQGRRDNTLPLQCIKTALNPKVEKEGDKIVFRVPQFTDEWTSSPFSVLDGYKMRLVLTRPSEVDQRSDFQRGFGGELVRTLTKVAVQLQLMKGENDNHLKWPINDKLSLVIIASDLDGNASLYPPHYNYGYASLIHSSNWPSNEMRVSLSGSRLGRITGEVPRELDRKSIEINKAWESIEISLSAKSSTALEDMEMPTAQADMYDDY